MSIHGIGERVQASTFQRSMESTLTQIKTRQAVLTVIQALAYTASVAVITCAALGTISATVGLSALFLLSIGYVAGREKEREARYFESGVEMQQRHTRLTQDLQLINWRF